MRQANVSSIRIGTLRRLAGGHPYFARWGLESLRTIESYCQIVDAPASVDLMELGALCPYEYFLLEGEVQLEGREGTARVVRAGDLDAGFPIAHLRPSQYRVTARTGARLMRVEASQLKRQINAASARRGQARFLLSDDSVGGSWRSHPLVVGLLRDARSGALQLPAMPGIALRIRRALARDDYDLDSIAAIIAADPAIAARLLKVANSALFGGQGRYDSVQAALVRLGVERAQSIVLGLATSDLFTARAAALKTHMTQRWRHAIDVAALCTVLARLTPGLDADRGLLVGLLHEIGALPVVERAEAFPEFAERPAALEEILNGLVPELSALVLEQWGFLDDFQIAARNQANWYREHEGGADYTDVLVVAHLHAMVRERAFHKLPRLDETPAFAKLALGLLSPQLSLLVLDEAKAQIQDLKSLLS
ncbi:MAG: HDOD domain-containing protein [Pseudomonadales bacterium]